MNLFADIRELVVAELEAMMAEGVLPKGLDLAAVAVEPPRVVEQPVIYDAD